MVNCVPPENGKLTFILISFNLSYSVLQTIIWLTVIGVIMRTEYPVQRRYIPADNILIHAQLTLYVLTLINMGFVEYFSHNKMGLSHSNQIISWFLLGNIKMHC